MAAGSGNNNHVGGPGSKFGGIDRPALGGGTGHAGGAGGGGLPPGLNPNRYSPNPTVTRPMSLHNMAALGNTIAPGGAFRAALGLGPQFEGPTGTAMGADYDPKNFVMQAGMAQGGARPGIAPNLLADLARINPGLVDMLKFVGRVPQTYATPAKPATAPTPGPMGGPVTSQPQKYLSVPGGPEYGLMVPGYKWPG